MMPRVKNKNHLKNITRATLSLVEKSGYTEITMANVAKEANIAVGTLYIYFKNKEQLINYIYLQLKEEKMLKITKGIKENDSFYTTFSKIWKHFFLFSIKEPHKVLFVEQYHFTNIITLESKEKAEHLLNPLYHIILNAQKENLVKEISPEIIINYIVGSVTELTKYFFTNNRIPSKKEINTCFEITWNGIRK